RDFSLYRRSRTARRIARRMQVSFLFDPLDYLEKLRADPEEAQLLSDDLLCNLTGFFRDPAAFAKLAADIIPGLFAAKDCPDSLRVWSVGCASGEEAYSIAILCLEEAGRQPGAPRIQIFASDLDNHCIGKARKGVYSVGISAEVSPERLERFFQG